jgi:sterol desaturase/sphingolipid hydroxylase (fatty acid hydroxylase superfamily)
MGIFSLEHSRAAYWADFVLYGVSTLLLSSLLLARSPPELGLEVLSCVLGGLLGWSAIEYVLHRFVLHGLAPFQGWHAEHHARPRALIGTPTILSATLIATLVFLPALLLGNLWRACALTLGLLIGYLAYAVMHHALHHWRAEHAWFKRRKHWHALHHRADLGGHYGVTSAFWDHALGTAQPRQRANAG